MTSHRETGKTLRQGQDPAIRMCVLSVDVGETDSVDCNCETSHCRKYQTGEPD